MKRKRKEDIDQIEQKDVKQNKNVLKKILLICWGLVTLLLIGGLVYVLFFSNRYKTYEVTFKTGDGSKVDKQLVVKGESVIEPIEPENEGYKFVGWYDGKNKYDFDDEVDGNLTLTAKWELAISEYEDIFYSQCYTKESVVENYRYESVDTVSIGDEIVCFVSFESYNGDDVEEIQFDVLYGDGLELEEVMYDYDLDNVDGDTYTFIYDDPMEVNEAGGFVFKVVGEDIDVTFENIIFVIDDEKYSNSNFELGLEMNAVEETEIMEYYDEVFFLQCYTKESVDKNDFKPVSTVSKGDKVVCYIGYETYSVDKVSKVNFMLNNGSSLKLLDYNLYSIGVKDDNKYSFEFSPTSVNDIAEYVFEITDENEDELFISIKDIHFETSKYIYSNNDVHLDFVVK